MPRKWFNAPVVRKDKLTENTIKLLLALDDAADFSFTAGQFITMDLPIGTKRNQRWRSYSIANADYGGRILELIIVKLDGGPGSAYLFDKIGIGDHIKFKGPDGGFVIPQVLDHEMIMVCTGTGIAPFRSMLWDIYLNKKDHKGIHLIFGTRSKDSILCEAELDYFKKQIPNFNYSICLSREEYPDYEKGYVHEVYMKRYKEVSVDRKFYLCGWTKMVDEAVENIILKLGYAPEQVKYELYG